MSKQGKKVRAADAESPAEPTFENPNKTWHLEVTTAIDVLVGHFGPDLQKRAAMPEAAGGFQAPLDFGLSQMRMDDETWTSSIIASGGCNVLWADPTTSMTPNVTINVKALKKFMRNYWPDDVVRPLAEP